jgi:hypothetical protein
MLTAFAPSLAGCGSGSGNPGNNPSGPSGDRVTGQSDFTSAPPAGQSNGGNAKGAADGASGGGAGGAATNGAATPSAPGTGGAVGTGGRQVQETDIYRLEGNKLYYLNSYRGLMVFDVTNVDAPKLVGRSPVFGDPVEMTVTNGICTMILGDWYGIDDSGDPFYGSVVRTVDATNPAAIKVLGDARVNGWVRDSRVVGHVLYMVSEDEGWYYGWGYYGGGPVGVGGGGVANSSGGAPAPAGGRAASNASTTSRAGEGAHLAQANAPTAAARLRAMTPNAQKMQAAMKSKSRANILSGLPGGGHADPVSKAPSGPKTIITSVDISSLTKPVTVSTQEYPGYSGAFNVTADTIVLAHDVPSDPSQPYSNPSGVSKLEFLDISDALGKIVVKSSSQVNGSFSGWGTDGGRWNVDYDETTHIGHVITCGENTQGGGWYCGGQGGSMVLSTLDFTVPTAPVLQSQLNIPSSGWSPAARFDTNRLYISPSSDYYGGGTNNTTPVQIFDLTDPKNPVMAGSTNITGTVWNFTPMGTKIFALGSNYTGTSNQIALQYIDVTDPKNPAVLGTAQFGQDWGYTPAAGTFKAFLNDTGDSMVVLPFSGWNNNSYQDGLQLIEYSPTSILTAGASHTKGWVERGILVKNRLVSLSDMALSVVDYTDKMAPKTTAELTLARNVVDAHPDGTTIAQLSTDWWGYDNTHSELRVLPITDAEEKLTDPGAISVNIDGTNAQVFRNGDMAYVVSQIYNNNPGANGYSWTEEVQVVDLSNGGAKLRGKLQLPTVADSYYYDGYWGCYWYDWWDSSAIVQVEGNALAFRRVQWQYNPQTMQETGNQTLYVADLSNPDAPAITGVQVTQQDDWWWGNVRAVGNTLYTSHYEWIQYPVYDPNNGNLVTQGIVRYYLDQIDLTDRTNPKVGKRINVPGFLVGSSETDDSLLYFVDYRWADADTTPHDEFSVAQVVNDKAYLQSTTAISGWTGNVFVRGNTAYLSAEEYNPMGPWGGMSTVKLHQIDLTDPKNPHDFSSAAKDGWGWLLDVEGDRAIVTSGWGSGLDLYKLSATQAPVFDQYARTRGWWQSSVSRQDNTIYLSSGYWGVQAIQLQ